MSPIRTPAPGLPRRSRGRPTRAIRPGFLLLLGLGLGLGVLASGCTPSDSPGALEDASDALLALEEEWFAAADREMDFEITAEGLFPVRIEGRFRLDRDGDVELRGEGDFGGEPATLRFQAEEGRMFGGDDGRGFDDPAPSGLRDAVVIGFTRMGLLHNLARLDGGLPPDQADGAVRAWVAARDVVWLETDEADAAAAGVPAGSRAFGFEIHVTDIPAGYAALWVDEDGTPLLREQTVQLEDGEMRVRERYRQR